MGIFFKGETRNINPVDTSSAGDIFSAFPLNTIPLSSLSWDEHKALQNSDIFTAITTLSKDIAKLDIRIKENGEEYIRVSFERPTENGFDTVVFELPSYEIVERDGNYSEEEIKEFRETVEKGAHLFFKYAREGGLKFA